MNQIIMDWFITETTEIADLLRAKASGYGDLWEHVRKLMLEMAERKGFNNISLYALPHQLGYEWYWYGYTTRF